MTKNPQIERFQIRTQAGGMIARSENPTLYNLLPLLKLEQEILGTPRIKDRSVVLSHSSLKEPLRISPQNKYFEELCAAINLEEPYVMACLEGRNPTPPPAYVTKAAPPLANTPFSTFDGQEKEFKHMVDGEIMQEAINNGALDEQEVGSRSWKRYFRTGDLSFGR